jgi:thymidylate synthase (FAD)
MKLIDWNDPQVANRLSPNDYLVHCPATFHFITDRGVSHEVVRHRPASYAQESTRYCAYSKDKFGGQVTYVDIASAFELDPKVNGLEDDCVIEIYKEWLLACEDAERHYLRMLELGSSPQMARSVLNNSTKTALVMTATLGEWAHYCKLRTDVAAHPQIREIAVQVNNQLAALNLIGLPFKEMTL